MVFRCGPRTARFDAISALRPAIELQLQIRPLANTSAGVPPVKRAEKRFDSKMCTYVFLLAI